MKPDRRYTQLTPDEPKQRKAPTPAQRLRMQALKTTKAFDPRGEGKTVFVSPAAQGAKELKHLKFEKPCEQVQSFASAALVIIPSLHLASNL